MGQRLLNNDRATERAVQQRMITRIANNQRDPVRKAIKAAIKAGASRLERDDGNTSGLSGAIEAERPRIEQALRGMYNAAFDSLGQRVLRAALDKGRAGAGERKQEGPEDAFNEAARAFIAEQMAQKADTILSTTGNQFRSIIAQAEREGVGTSEIARRIRVQSETLSRVRSQLIARTETHMAANKAQQEAARRSRVADRQEWIAANDDRTRDDRFDHRAADGEMTTLDQPFTRTGEPLDYPGDSVGSPGNVINCRCGTAFLVE